MHPNLTRTLRWFGLLETGRRVELRLRLREARALPDALIIGAMKCGTSSLHNYLVQHPAVIAPLRKEVHYFDLNFDLGLDWYRANFGVRGAPGFNLDSSPSYLFLPTVAARAHALLPHAKLVVMLRDPVRRAYSHYWHERHKRRETLSFEDAIAAEPDRLAAAAGRLECGDADALGVHLHCSYLARGRYAEQIERWLEFYPRDQLLVLRFEDLVREPLVVLNRTLACFGLQPMTRARLEPRNTRRYPSLDDATAQRLQRYFEPHDARLERLLGERVAW